MAAHELIPSARRLMKSLRDMGYDFAQAVADVVDNSIEARANRIEIDFVFDGDESWLRIADNGDGMAPKELRAALRYGSDRDYEADDLGKFGLGLKTASMSQCRCLTVASRRNTQRADIAAYSWDLDHIERVDRWEILPVETDDPRYEELRLPLEDAPGTVVMWRQLDRILGYQHPYGEAAKRRSASMARDLEQHLSMVFHKFLAGEVRGKQVKIYLNSNQVRPWDPFCRSEPATKAFEKISLAYDDEGVKGTITFEPFILPHQDEFSTRDAFDTASGPNNWNQQQGFYVYRAGRMIQSGGWSHLRTADEHTKLARIAVMFTPALDEAFKVNVAKMRVQMPASLRDEIRKLVQPITKRAKDAYSRRISDPTSGKGGGPTSTGDNPDGRNGGNGRVGDSTTKPPFNRGRRELASELLAAAKQQERPTVRAVLIRAGWIDEEA